MARKRSISDWAVPVRRTFCRAPTSVRDERGSTTIQEVLWAIAAIAFVAIVVAAINSFLTSQVAKIR